MPRVHLQGQRPPHQAARSRWACSTCARRKRGSRKGGHGRSLHDAAGIRSDGDRSSTSGSTCPTGKAAASLHGASRQRGIPELLGGDLSAASTLQQLLATMDACGVDVGVVALGCQTRKPSRSSTRWPSSPTACAPPSSTVRTDPSSKACGSACRPLTLVRPGARPPHSSTSTRSTTKLYYPIYRLPRARVAGVHQRGHPRPPRPLGLPTPRAPRGRPHRLQGTRPVIGAHMGHPYEALLMQYMLKWPDLYLSNSAYLAKYMEPERLPSWASKRGLGRVLYASDHPFLPMERAIDAARDLPLSSVAAEAYLGGTAAAPEAGLNRGSQPGPRWRVVERLVAPHRDRGSNAAGELEPSATARCGPPAASRRAWRALRESARRDATVTVASRHRQHLDHAAGGCRSGEVADLEDGYDGRFLFGHRREPPCDRLRLRPALLAHGRVSRRSRRPRAPHRPPRAAVLAALGPRMLELAKDRAAGAHPYFVPVEHTAFAREALGPGPVLATEVAVVLGTDRTDARPSPASTPASTCRCRTMRTTFGASATPTTTSRAAGATD